MDSSSSPSDESLFLALQFFCLSIDTYTGKNWPQQRSLYNAVKLLQWKSFSLWHISKMFHPISKTWGYFEPSFVQQSNTTVPKCSWLLQFHHTKLLWKLLFNFPFWLPASKPKFFTLQQNTPAAKTRSMATCVCTHTCQAWKERGIFFAVHVLLSMTWTWKQLWQLFLMNRIVARKKRQTNK